MLDKLESIEERFVELEEQMSQPELMSRREDYQKCLKEHARLQDKVNVYREYKKAKKELEQAKEMLAEGPDGEPDYDREMADYLKEECAELSTRMEELESELKLLLLPKDPGDEKNVIIEIRAGTGGEEAALFSADLMRMYMRFAEKLGWKTEMIDINATDIGGIKEVVFALDGRDVYSRLKFESGVHRVQRVPTTESSGRIHTSAATVAVLAEAEDIEVEINPQDIRIDIFCSTGPGGQSVNTTQSAVRITHLPTGTVSTCQDEKSQHKNKDKAMRVLRTRIFDQLKQQQDQEIAASRKSQVGSGDRSERIRTYNFPQNRVTDHRIGLTLHKLEQILQGDLDEIVDTLRQHHQAELLVQLEK